MAAYLLELWQYYQAELSKALLVVLRIDKSSYTAVSW
jgi:hypothetical protein